MRTSLILMLSCIICLYGHAQTSVNSSGGDATGSGGSSSYSVGQVVYTTIFSETGSVAQGVQHPFMVTITSGLQFTNINLQVETFPNPATNYLHIAIEDYVEKDLSYRLFNTQGKLMQAQKIVDPLTTVPMEELAAATYFLTISNRENELKTFKVVKTK